MTDYKSYVFISSHSKNNSLLHDVNQLCPNKHANKNLDLELYIYDFST